jgi:mono/diheme cytochrome c family protein
MRKVVLTLGALLGVGAVAAGAFVYFGTYNVAADDPHWDITTRFLESVRDQSVARRARAVGEPPNLEDQQRILRGAGEYAAMCVNCHLAPGVEENQLSRGLYPQPPRLDKRQLDPRRAFVIIKHGLKMTGMPAWGSDHGDEAVWGIVAFVAKLPRMTPQQYQETVARAPAGMHGPVAPAAGQQMPAGMMESMPHGAPGHHGPAASAAASAPASVQSATQAANAAPAPHGPPGHHDAKK